jgi:uncharacterized damage-inducible protein DinB
MSVIQSLVKEMEREAVTTRKMLARVPDDKFDWKPHEKSMPVRQLAVHIAELPSWATMVLTTSELDFANNPYHPAAVNSTSELLEVLEKSLTDGMSHLEKATEAQLEENWSLRNGDQVFFTNTKGEVIRTAYCQIVHHRAQLGVYLRLLNIPIPGSYGPSADEPAMVF